MSIIKHWKNKPANRYGFFLLSLVLLLISTDNIFAQTTGIKDESTTNDSTTAEQSLDRELTAEEDPLVEREAEMAGREKRWYEEPNKARIYGSARIRYRHTGDESAWGDGGSRVGIESHWQMLPKRWLIGGLEIGFNLLDRIDQLIDPSSNSKEGRGDIFERLAYIGYEGPNLLAVFGKNWSSYYKVASFTDRFEGTGGDAGGAFNAQTDGGATGTGRADKVLQTRIHIDFFPEAMQIKPFKLNLQVQHGEPIPGVDNVDYGTAFGASAILNLMHDFTLGVAYNHAEVRDPLDPEVIKAGIDGDARALIIGSRWYGERWYLGAIVSRLENHETTDTQVYFDGTGSELYGQYQVRGPWWLTGGYNYLRPDDDQYQAGQYKIGYGVIGLRYSVDKFRKMFYFNARIDNGSYEDGQELSNIYTVGVHWNLEKTFSWVSLPHR